MDKRKIIIIGVIVVTIIAVICTVLLRKKIQNDRDYELLQVSEYKYYALLVNGKYGVIRKDGIVIVEPNYDEVQIPNQDRDVFVVKEDNNYKVLNEKNEELYADKQMVVSVSTKDDAEQTIYNTTVLKYMENGKYGLLSLDGQKITEAEYDEIEALKNNSGEVLVKQKGKFGVINVRGNSLVAIKYDYVTGDGYSENGSYKNSGYIVGNMTDQGMKYGYLDKDEKEILKIEQESLYRVTEINSGDAYLVASQNGRYAIYKNKDNLTDYKYLDVIYNNGTNTFTVQKNKTYGLVNLSGQVVIPEEYQELMVVGIYVKALKNETNYIFDLNGKQVENSKFASLQQTSTGKFYITIDNNYKYGIANQQYEVVIENKYDYIYEIEKTGLLIATIEDDVTIYSGSAVEIVSVQDAKTEISGDYIKVITSDDSYYLTVDGKKVDNKTVYLENNIYASKDNKKWGFVDLRNSIIVPYEYDEVTEIDEFGFAGVKKNGKWGVINSEGQVILEPTYASDEINPVFIGKYALKNNIVSDQL